MALPASDPEKHAPSPAISSLAPSLTTSPSPSPATSVQPAPTSFPTPTNGLLARLRRYEALLDRKFGIEAHGPARILPDRRDNPPPTWVMAALWASGTMNLSCFATGFLGWEFGLSLRQSVLTIVFGTLLGAMVTGWCATLGMWCTFFLPWLYATAVEGRAGGMGGMSGLIITRGI
jgi:hypothetical protein